MKAFRAAICAVTIGLLAGCGGNDQSAAPSSAAPSAELRAASDRFAGRNARELVADGDAMRVAGDLFAAYCANCHGAGGTGARGVPDLTRGRFDFGSSIAAIETTIRDGRHSEMPGMGREYGEVELGQIVGYVQALPRNEPLTEYESRGETFYAESCVACHGADGRGNTDLGAPSLVDDYWQHGDSMMNIRLAITRGTESTCPAQGDVLNAIEIALLGAYVGQLSADGVVSWVE